MSPIDTLLSEDNATVAQSLSIMMKKEQTIYTTRDYLHSPDPSSSQSSPSSPDEMPTRVVTPSDRMMIVDWCYSIIDQVKLNRETVAIAMEMVDRFLSKPSSIVIASRALHDRREYQLIVITALYIAVKTTEPTSVMNSQLFSDVSQGMYSVQDIEHMEITILEGLEWRLCAPTSIQMAHHILSLVLPHFANTMDDATSAFVLDEVRFQTEFAVRDYYFAIMQRPSTVAVAAIFNALDQVDNSRTREDCQAVLSAFLSANGEFACNEDLLAAKNRLYCLVEDNDYYPNVNDNGDDDDDTDSSSRVSETSRETMTCSSKRPTCEGSLNPKKSLRTWR